jgi:hypothetical protein
MKEVHPPATALPRTAASKSRLVDADPGFARTSAAHPMCDVCHWTVLPARRFKGRIVCLACIAEHCAEDGDET